MLNPSRVEVPAPAPVILVPTYIALVTDKPPERTTAAVVKLEASVAEVNVTAPEAARVVNAAVLGDDEPMLEPVIVLLLKVSVPAKVARVPVTGSVNVVLAVVVSVVVCAPEVVKLPPIVIVLPVFATPVPPYAPATAVPCQVPVAIVPRVVIDD